MSYRVEIAKQGRAGCQNTPCKAQGIKIQKGEFRFGIWVELEHGASFRWKHWGCVSGFQLQNLREYLKQGDPDGEYKWEFMDGLDELPEEYQKKLKTAVIEGKIADEDWKGDPAYNQLGQKGTQPRPKKAKKTAEGEDENGEGSPPAPAPKKRRRGKKTEDSDDEDIKPPPKRTKKPKKEEAEADSQPVPKKERRKRSTKKEESGDEVKAEESEVEKKPAGKSKTKKGAKKEEPDEDFVKEEENHTVDTKSAKKSRARKIKEERIDEADATEALGEENLQNPRTKKTKQETKVEAKKIKAEPEADDAIDIPERATKSRSKKSKREAVKNEDAASSMNNGEEDGDVKPIKRGRRAKKEDALAVTKDEDVESESETGEQDTRGRRKMKVEAKEGAEIDAKPPTKRRHLRPNSAR